MIFRSKNFLGLFLLFFLLLPFKAEADFYRSLKLSDTGGDVVVLQQVLNRDPETMVAEVGPGSIGNETSYFGELTRQAVIRLQNKYQAEILTPVGLTSGTGYVGPSTLAKLSSLIIGSPAKFPVGEVNPNPTSSLNIPPPPPLLVPEKTTEANKTKSSFSETERTASSLAGTTEPRMSALTKISSISPTSGRPGTRITIKGVGFSKEGNDVFAGKSFIKGVPSKDGTTIIIEIQDPFSVVDSGYLRNLSFNDPSISIGADIVRDAINGLSKQNFVIPLGVFIRNNTGVSNTKTFQLKY